VVAVAHPGRDDPSEVGGDYRKLCEAVGALPERCGIKLNWDRPEDVYTVLDYLERSNDGSLAYFSAWNLRPTSE